MHDPAKRSKNKDWRTYPDYVKAAVNLMIDEKRHLLLILWFSCVLSSA